MSCARHQIDGGIDDGRARFVHRRLLDRYWRDRWPPPSLAGASSGRPGTSPTRGWSARRVAGAYRRVPQSAVNRPACRSRAHRGRTMTCRWWCAGCGHRGTPPGRWG